MINYIILSRSLFASGMLLTVCYFSCSNCGQGFLESIELLRNKLNGIFLWLDVWVINSKRDIIYKNRDEKGRLTEKNVNIKGKPGKVKW